MRNKTLEMTRYFRSAVAASSNMNIDFKKDNFYIITFNEIMQGRINPKECKKIFDEVKKKEKKKVSEINIIISAKTIKTLFEANEKVQDDIDELTGIYFIPACLNKNGTLSYDKETKKLPWFPREFLTPMVEPLLAIGRSVDIDTFMSNHVDQVQKINSWSDYVVFFKKLYKTVTDTTFEQETVRSLDPDKPYLELESNMYIFIDNTVSAFRHIMELYNHLQIDSSSKKLYENFVATKMAKTKPLIENNLSSMLTHNGQMNGEYSLSPSQREAINHFNLSSDGDILAINGPPGTGKTTLLQTIVADLYVKRALGEKPAPLIVASSTNNQAILNIVDSFGSIKKIGISNLEERWIEGVTSFATYFPSSSKMSEAIEKGYQITNKNKEFFFSDIEAEDNVGKSRIKLITSCNNYFANNYKNILDCQKRLHDELKFIEQNKKDILSLAHNASQYDFKDQTLDKYLFTLQSEIEEKQTELANIKIRVNEWINFYRKIPFLVKLLSGIKVKSSSKRIQTEFRLFINDKELGFLDEYMTLGEIKEIYSHISANLKFGINSLKQQKQNIEDIMASYDALLEQLQQHNINFLDNQNERYNLDLEHINNLLDTKHRYIAFWLAVHYYECEWLATRNRLTDKQRGSNIEDVQTYFYNTLSMLTPCLVMTFFMLPANFKAYEEPKSFYLYNHIDLLIVDEAGQVSPEIAAPSFSLAKKALVVGDIHQIEPIWNVNQLLDKALAISNGVISDLSEFETLELVGLNSSSSSVMKVAAKSCNYEKFNDKGLFLSEHRRCYDEIIDYCNELVYKGNLEPLRGEGENDKKRAIKQFPQMAFYQVDTKHSSKLGTSRANRLEAEQIAKWLGDNFDKIIKSYHEEPLTSLVGIITPFKAQVSYINSALKKYLPSYHSQISVGTVHTFQGAERRIIIMSTVYGKDDGCFFIDANKNLMNVAVSRAKDNFFVFGDVNCLVGSSDSPSGLLKEYIHGNDLSEISL